MAGRGKHRFALGILGAWLLLSGATVHAESAAADTIDAAWSSYHAAFSDILADLKQDERFSTPQNQPAVYRRLMELQALAYNLVIAPRTAYPRLFSANSFQTDIYSMGSSGADFNYSHLFLDGERQWRLRVRKGEVQTFLVQVQSDLPGTTDARPIGSFDIARMVEDADGWVDIIVGGPRQAGNWIPLDEKSENNYLFIRRVIPNWGKGDMGEMKIEPLSPPSASKDNAQFFDPARTAERIRKAEQFVRHITRSFTFGLYAAALDNADGQKNRITVPKQAASLSSADAKYAMGVFSLAEHEALLIEFTPPAAPYWSFQLGDAWVRALNFVDHQTSLNNGQISSGPDGRVRIIIAHRDPGVANWLDTNGWGEGLIYFRMYGSEQEVPPIHTRKIALDRSDHPAIHEMEHISSTERQRILRDRRAAILGMLGE